MIVSRRARGTEAGITATIKVLPMARDWTSGSVMASIVRPRSMSPIIRRSAISSAGSVWISSSHAGIALAKALDRVRQDAERRRRARAHTQEAELLVPDTVGKGLQDLNLAEDTVGIAVQQPCFRRRHQASAAALEQAIADLALEMAQHFANRGLRHVQGDRRSRQRSVAHDGAEDFELTRVHADRSCRPDHNLGFAQAKHNVLALRTSGCKPRPIARMEVAIMVAASGCVRSWRRR